MSARVELAAHVDIDAGTAEYLTGDPDFGLSSVPANLRRGHLELRPWGGRQLAVFWPADDPGHAVPAPSIEIAAAWSALAAIAPRATTLEVALGSFGHRDPHWRLIDLLRLDTVDTRPLPTLARYQALLGVYRQVLDLRSSMLELAHLFDTEQDKAAYATEGPGRLNDRLAFRRLSAVYGDPWFLAPVGWTKTRERR